MLLMKVDLSGAEILWWWILMQGRRREALSTGLGLRDPYGESTALIRELWLDELAQDADPGVCPGYGVGPRGPDPHLTRKQETVAEGEDSTHRPPRLPGDRGHSGQGKQVPAWP